MSVALEKRDAVFVLTMTAGENRFNRGFLDAMAAALDEVEASTGPAALVTVGGAEKFYSNGLDLAWMAGAGAEEGADFVYDVQSLFARLLVFPVPTVAALNGHAFAGGAMMALSHDYRVMRIDRGFFCLPEVDIHIPLTPGMTRLIQAKLDLVACRDLILTGRRVGGAEAVTYRVADEAVPADQVLERAVARAQECAGKDRTTYAALKRELYADAIAVLVRRE